jgi:acetyl esterase
MKLDPGIEAYIAACAALDGPPVEPPPPWPERRVRYAQRCRQLDRARPPGVEVEEAAVPGPAGAIPVRVVRPAEQGARGTIVYFHGGGWVVGDLDTHDRITADLAAETGMTVVAVHYRLAPEHPYPASFDDAYAATAQLAAGAGPPGVAGSRLVVAGDSAGGNLAAATALAARDRGGPALRGQALIYPCLDARLGLPSHRENARAPMLTTAEMADYWAAYLGGRAPEPYAAPLEARALAGLPPAFVSTAGHDPLRDDGRVYAERLRAAGVAVELRDAPTLVHGFLRARAFSEVATAEFQSLCRAVRAMVAG